MLHGIKLCSNSDFLKVQVESDSMLIYRKMVPPWQIKHIIEQIWEYFKFTHTFREGNIVAHRSAC